MSGFTKNDKVVSETGTAFTIEHGPYTGLFGGTMYLVENDSGRCMQVLASALSAVPADPRRDVVATALQQQEDNGIRTWESVSEDGKALYRADADAVLAALDAHAQHSGNGPFWDDLQEDLKDPALRAEYEKESLRVADAFAADAPSRYRDIDGGTWRRVGPSRLSLETRNGTPYGGRVLLNVLDEDAEESYGPLTCI